MTATMKVASEMRSRKDSGFAPLGLFLPWLWGQTSDYSIHVRSLLLSVDDGTGTVVAGLRTPGSIHQWGSRREEKERARAFLAPSAEPLFTERMSGYRSLFNRKQMHRDAEVQRQPLDLVRNYGVVALAWSSMASPHKLGPSAPWAQGGYCPTCLFSIKCGETQDPHYAPSLPESSLPFPFFLPFLFHLYIFISTTKVRKTNQ